jgi:hypothetical protein
MRKIRGGGVASVLALAALFWGVGAASGAEEVAQNDSIVDFGEAVIVGDFIAGEMAGAVLTSPCDGAIVAVQILWLEGVAGHGESLEEAIHIYEDGGTFPVPGTELQLLEGPVLTPGYWNEFRYTDEAQTIPLNVPVSQGQDFYVTLEFYNPTDVGLPEGSPSVVRDNDGWNPGRNVLYGNVPPPWGSGWTWYDFNEQSTVWFIAGDLGFRAVIDCPGVTGACCDLNGDCMDGVEEMDCQGPFDTWFGEQPCASLTCPDPVGACCNGTGGCLEARTQTACEDNLSGIYAGNGTTCASGVCDLGACCLLPGTCEDVIELECDNLGGAFQGAGTDCATTQCPQPEGACCVDQTCVPDQTEENCTGFGGEWVGAFTDCGPPDPCAVPYCGTLSNPAVCMGDANGDGQVTPSDVGLVKFFYGDTQQDSLCYYDINCDGTINPADVGLVKFYYGTCDAGDPPPCWAE